jgi:hypothetical protein
MGRLSVDRDEGASDVGIAHGREPAHRLGLVFDPGTKQPDDDEIRELGQDGAAADATDIASSSAGRTSTSPSWL